MNSPPTVRQTEIGVASSSPTGPHSQPQKIADDEQRDRRDADAMSDHDRLDESADELIAQHEQAEDRERRVPVRKDRQREERRHRRAQNRADVRDEPQQSREHAPQRRVRHAAERTDRSR